SNSGALQLRPHEFVVERQMVKNSDQFYKQNVNILEPFTDRYCLSCSLNGMYVMIGETVKYESGPSIVISFVIAAIAAILCGLCFCELSAKVQSSGAAYSYLYVTMGEFLAFLMGWNYILQYIIALSSDARALSKNLDSLAFNKISNFSLYYVKMSITGLAEYPDFLSFLIIIITSSLLMFGIKESSFINKSINIGNLSIMIIIMIFGFYKADIKNWEINLNEINKTKSNETILGKGGFFPYGYQGIFDSIARCFYAFIGFDAIASTTEESKNPKRDTPNAIVLAILLLSFLYTSLSCVLTLLEPYYLIDENTPFSSTFEYAYSNFTLGGFNIFKILILVNVLLSIFVSIYGEIYVASRIISAMALDGLLFKFLSKLSKKYQTPFYATLLAAIVSGSFSVLFDLMELLDILSLGTLSAYCVVSVCVILLRFSPNDLVIYESNESLEQSHASFFEELIKPTSNVPNLMTKRIINTLVIISVFTMISICVLLRVFSFCVNLTMFMILAILIGFSFVLSVLIYKQPQFKNESSFKIPYLPFLPFMSFLINMYLMLTISLEAWLILSVWMVVGIVIYFTYSINHSQECPKKRKKLNSLADNSTRMTLLSQSS
ncbi:unnamed protein product, partial [Brachionus calyciflorus]